MVTSVYPEVGQTNYTVNETEPVMFECTATGIPAPDIEINSVNKTSRVQVVATSTPIEVVRIFDQEVVYLVTQTAAIYSTVDADTGVYQCIARNNIPEMATDSAQFEFIVQGK